MKSIGSTFFSANYQIHLPMVKFERVLPCLALTFAFIASGCGGGSTTSTSTTTAPTLTGTGVVASQVEPSANLPAPGYKICATELQRCLFQGVASVIYGSGNNWTAARVFTDGVDCNTTVFGDPAVGVLKACYVLLSGTTAPVTPVIPTGNTAFEVSNSELLDSTKPLSGTPHEALAEGVPLSYDWSLTSRLGQGNSVPAGFGALIGWGQVFWRSGTTEHSHAVEIGPVNTYLCSGASRQWSRVQKDIVVGAAFRPDFANNEAVAASVIALDAERVRVTYPAGRAFHYWAQQGRVSLPGATLCGVLVLFQARAVAADGSTLAAGTAPQMVIGAGADYWSTTTASWDNYRTNRDVGIGQLRLLTPTRKWYGLSTADTVDLQRLFQSGFVDRVAP
jgi:hypothetical protein